MASVPLAFSEGGDRCKFALPCDAIREIPRESRKVHTERLEAADRWFLRLLEASQRGRYRVCGSAEGGHGPEGRARGKGQPRMRPLTSVPRCEVRYPVIRRAVRARSTGALRSSAASRRRPLVAHGLDVVSRAREADERSMHGGQWPGCCDVTSAVHGSAVSLFEVRTSPRTGSRVARQRRRRSGCGAGRRCPG